MQEQGQGLGCVACVYFANCAGVYTRESFATSSVGATLSSCGDAVEYRVLPPYKYMQNCFLPYLTCVGEPDHAFGNVISRRIEHSCGCPRPMYLCSNFCVSSIWVDRTPEGPRAPQLDHRNRSWMLVSPANGPVQGGIPPAAEYFGTPASDGSRGNSWCVAWNGHEGNEWGGDSDIRHDTNMFSLPEIS